MVPSKSNNPKRLFPAVRKRAKRIFANRADQEELIADAISLAWEFSLTAPDDATVASLAYYACQKVKVRRQFQESTRSIDGPNPRRMDKAPRETVDVELIPNGRKDNPADVGAMRVDFPEWLETLTDREQALLLNFLSGETTETVAKNFRLSPARISQIRRELIEHWTAFTG